MSSPVSYDLQGQGGGRVLVGGEVAENVRWIQFLTDSTINDILASNLADAIEITNGYIIPAGVGFGGKIEYIELNSGLAIAYFA
jgi:hypothetical protein